jgi:CMP-N,N'-diacetyllegionaminic acid synthase
MQEKILCTICAREGSKGVKNKNIRNLSGKPLIAQSIEHAKQTGLFQHIVVSTDSDEIAEQAKTYGADVFFKRPAELATDAAAKIPVIRHALQESEKHYGHQMDVVIDLDLTSPLRFPQDIIQAFHNFQVQDNDNLITAAPARRSPYFNLVEQDATGKVFLSKKQDQPIVRRQDAPKCFDMNASFYIWKREILLHHDTLFLKNTGLYIMPEERSLDIDSELDFKIVEFLFENRREEI